MTFRSRCLAGSSSLLLGALAALSMSVRDHRAGVSTADTHASTVALAGSKTDAARPVMIAYAGGVHGSSQHLY